MCHFSVARVARTLNVSIGASSSKTAFVPSLLGRLRAGLEGTVGIATGLHRSQWAPTSCLMLHSTYIDLLARVLVVAVETAEVASLLRGFGAGLEGAVGVPAVLREPCQSFIER